MYAIGKPEVEAVRRVIMSGKLFRFLDTAGETVTFEKEWVATVGARYALVVTSGTAALICGLAGMGIGPGDEVVVPAYTFMATALAPLAVGAIPVIAEVDDSLTLDPQDFERKVTARTRAVIPVHMCGLPCDMDSIMRIARKHKLQVLEDACQADGGSYRGRRLGSIGKAGAFSFNFYKIMTCGEGGALTTSDRELYERALIHHDGGCSFRPQAKSLKVPIFAGWNFRMHEILSAILRVQLRRLEKILAALRREKRILMEEIAGAGAFSFNPVNDPQGDCGTTLVLLFPSKEEARAFVKRSGQQGLGASSPINSGRHVYRNWEPVMMQRGAHHPGRDAFQLTALKRDEPDPFTLAA